MTQTQYEKILERLDFIEFRQDLLFYESEVNRILYEYGITKKQYEDIMDLMDEIRDDIIKNKKYSKATFEKKLYDIVPQHLGNYYMCEDLAKGFMEEGRWEEVFNTVYGELPKYSYLKREK